MSSSLAKWSLFNRRSNPTLYDPRNSGTCTAFATADRTWLWLIPMTGAFAAAMAATCAVTDAVTRSVMTAALAADFGRRASRARVRSATQSLASPTTSLMAFSVFERRCRRRRLCRGDGGEESLLAFALALLRLLELLDVPERPLPCLPAGDRRPLPALEPSAELSPVPSGVSDGMLAVARRAEVAMPPPVPVGADGEGVPVVAATSVVAGVARRRCL